MSLDEAVRTMAETSAAQNYQGGNAHRLPGKKWPRLALLCAAVLLALLFAGQFLVPDAQGRHLFSLAYLVGAAIILVMVRDARDGMLRSYGNVWQALRGQPAT